MPSPQEVVSSTSLMYRFSSHSSLRDNLHASLQGESQDLRNKLIDVLLGGGMRRISTGHLPQTMIEFSFNSGTAHCSV